MFWPLSMFDEMPTGGGGSGCAVAGVVTVEEAGEGVDGFEQQGVDPGLLVSGVLGVVARDETAPLCCCLLLGDGGVATSSTRRANLAARR